MPPKNSKKEVAKIQKKVIEDKTFGLKNKNKSKVVQGFVAQVTEQAKRAGLSKEEQQRQEQIRQARAAKKDEKIAAEKEQALLFNPAAKKKLEAAAKKKAADEAAAAAAKAAEGPEFVSAEEAYLEAKRQADMDRADAILGPQADDDLYEKIEMERAEIKKKGGLTPVTFDSFVAWKARKAEERKKQDVADAKLAIAAASKMKGKSGRDMFNALIAGNADLFLDDDDADDDWMKREKNDDDDEEEIFDVTVTGTSLQLKRVDKPAANAQAGGEAAAKGGAVDALANKVDASLFMDDVELPSDDDDE